MRRGHFQPDHEEDLPLTPFADNFLAGSLLSLLLPVGLLIAIAVWYVLSLRRIPDGSEQPQDDVPKA